jgi:spermidine synthase
VRLNRDLAPICYYYDLALWLSRFYPSTSSGQAPSASSGPVLVLRGIFEGTGLVGLWWAAVPLALAVLLVRWRRGGAVPLAIAGIGLAEMTLEVVILFAFQVLHGTVYARVSLIVTAFMGGLALGGAAGERLLARQSAAGSRQSAVGGRRARRALIAIQAAVALYSAVFPLILSLPIPAPVLVFPLLALVAGALTGMAFPLAVALTRGGAGRAAGLLYGTDLVGGCVGALVSAVFLVPVLGIPQTCAAVALVGLAGLVALV